jgi:hypothetical protein
MGNDSFWPVKDVSMLEELIFLPKESIQQEGFSNL